MRMAMEMADYEGLRREQAEKRARGELMGIGISFFTETVGAGPRKDMDIAGLSMNDGAELRVHPTGKAVLSISVQTQGQGHETTFAQIVAEELGIPPEDVEVVHGDTDLTPFGLGTYGSRSTPVSGAATAITSRKVRDKARLIAAAMLEASPADLEWEKGRWYVKGSPDRGKTIQEIAFGAYTTPDMPDEIESNLEAVTSYNPTNLTFPFGAYICVVDIDPGTGHVKVRRFIAVDDCGTRINPTIIEGQIHGGLAEGIGIALMEFIGFDENGNCLNGSFMDYLIPTSMEVPDLELGHTVTPSPHHPIGAKGVGESPTVGSPPAIVNAILDALRPGGGEAHRHALLAGPRLGRHAGPGGTAGMMRADLTRAAAELTAARTPFVVATVVRVEKPASAHPGDTAIVHPDGRIDGFVGGACATSTVRLHALRVLETEQALLLRIQPNGEGGPVEAGISTVVNSCLSGGTLEIFLEPQLPAPVVRVLGDSPVAESLRQLAAPLGFEVATGGVAEAGDAAVVIASLGHDDEQAVEQALASGAGYVALVASHRRGGAVVEALRTSGLVRDHAGTPAHPGRPGHRSAHACRDRAVDSGRARAGTITCRAHADRCGRRGRRPDRPRLRDGRAGQRWLGQDRLWRPRAGVLLRGVPQSLRCRAGALPRGGRRRPRHGLTGWTQKAGRIGAQPLALIRRPVVASARDETI